MNKNILSLFGAIILLFSMTFAMMNLETADQWVGMWIPFVAAGVFLAIFGVILKYCKSNPI